MKNSQLYKQARQLKRESRDATQLDFNDSLGRDPKEALQGWNEYECQNCFFRFKSHYEQFACPYCKSPAIEYQGYTNTLYLEKEQRL